MKRVSPDKLISDSKPGIVVNDEVYVMFPAKYVDKGLAKIGNEINVLGVFILKNNKDEYVVINIPAILNINGIDIEKEIVNEIEYYKIKIEKNDRLLSEDMIAAIQDIPYMLLDYFLLDGKIPFFMEYTDLIKLFSKLAHYTKVSKLSNTLAFEILLAKMVRTIDDLTKEYRYDIKSDYVIIGLSNIWYSYRTTFAKISGNYLSNGLISSIINSPENSTRLDMILRK